MNEFEELAVKTASESLCEKRKVGAVLVYQGTVLSYANNYHPNAFSSCELEDGSTDPKVIHAEVAALEAAHKEFKHMHVPLVLYVTHEPCTNCMEYINAYCGQHDIKIHIKVVEQFMKFDTDKLRYDLIPPSAMKALAEVLTYGAKKYKPNNWKNGDKDRYIAALYRHLEAWRAGEQKDEESGMTHLSHALTNVAFLLELDNGHE